MNVESESNIKHFQTNAARSCLYGKVGGGQEAMACFTEYSILLNRQDH